MTFKLLPSLFLIACASPALARFIPSKMVVGASSSCALSTDGSVKCWGSNINGELGVGTNVKHGQIPDSMGKNLPTVNLGTQVIAKDICAGGTFVCALTQSSKVKCWGANDVGQLAQGHGRSIGSRPTDMGDALAYSNLGSDFEVASLACGSKHACAVNQNGKAKCWGGNENGQLGIESKDPVGLTPAQVGDNMPFLKIDKKIKQISLGARFSCALLIDGEIKCWGENSYGNSGIESTESYGVQKGSMANLPGVRLESGPYTGIAISTSYVHSCATYLYQNKTKFKCWGYNGVESGRIGVGSKSEFIGEKPNSMAGNLPEVQHGLTALADFKAMGTFTCAVEVGGNLKCWGHNGQGQLGLENTNNYANSAETSGKNLPYVALGLPVRSISSGSASNHVCAILINGYVKCWGYNASGQLGYEDEMNRGSSPGDMADHLLYVVLD